MIVILRWNLSLLFDKNVPVAPIVVEVVGKLYDATDPDAPVKYWRQSGGPPWVSPHSNCIT